MTTSSSDYIHQLLDKLESSYKSDALLIEKMAKALKPFKDACFNDNGDFTVEGPYPYDEAINGYFAYKAYMKWKEEKDHEKTKSETSGTQ